MIWVPKSRKSISNKENIEADVSTKLEFVYPKDNVFFLFQKWMLWNELGNIKSESLTRNDPKSSSVHSYL